MHITPTHWQLLSSEFLPPSSTLVEALLTVLRDSSFWISEYYCTECLCTHAHKITHTASTSLTMPAHVLPLASHGQLWSTREWTRLQKSIPISCSKTLHLEHICKHNSVVFRNMITALQHINIKNIPLYSMQYWPLLSKKLLHPLSSHVGVSLSFHVDSFSWIFRHRFVRMNCLWCDSNRLVYYIRAKTCSHVPPLGFHSSLCSTRKRARL